jgi:hypothetical protein
MGSAIHEAFALRGVERHWLFDIDAVPTGWKEMLAVLGMDDGSAPTLQSIQAPMR